MKHLVDARVTILVLTNNRRAQLLHKLEALCRLPERCPIIVVDNGSSDGTAAVVALRFPQVLLVCATRNIGAAARNIGVAYVHTPYVAFCDDDVQWESNSLKRAVHLLDAATDVAVLSAHVKAGPTRTTVFNSRITGHRMRGPEPMHRAQLLGFKAGACVMRTRAFYDVGGYWPPLFLGGEDALMALDLAERGWRIVYADDVVAQHLPGLPQDSRQRQYRYIRNAIWVAWMRRPIRAAWRETYSQFVRARQCDVFGWTVLHAFLGLPRALGRRRVISRQLEEVKVALERQAADLITTKATAFKTDMP